MSRVFLYLLSRWRWARAIRFLRAQLRWFGVDVDSMTDLEIMQQVTALQDMISKAGLATEEAAEAASALASAAQDAWDGAWGNRAWRHYTPGSGSQD